MALPPSPAGGVKFTLTRPSRKLLLNKFGAPGTVRGVTDTGADATPVPATLVAVTLHE